MATITRLTTEEQQLAIENFNLINKAVGYWYKRNNLSYDEVHDACTYAFVKSCRLFDSSLGFKFITLYYRAAAGEVKKVIRDKLAQKRAPVAPLSLDYEMITRNGETMSLVDLLGTSDNYSFINTDQIPWNVVNKNQRFAIYLYYYKQYTQEEIARDMNCSQVHVSRLIREGLGKMRIYLKGAEAV